MIDDAAEATVVDRQVPGNILSHVIGASDLVTENVFLTVTNLPMRYVNWGAGEPSGGTAKNCVTFNDNTMLFMQDCSSADDYVCEYDGIAPVPAAWGQ